jgi:rhodanese-related sulfurtransferase
MVHKRRLMPVAVLLFFALLAIGCSGSTAMVTPPRADTSSHFPQDPDLRITTAEVMALFAEVYGGDPLNKATLDRNNTFLLVDARPLGRYQEGHVPGAIHMHPSMVAENIDKLPRDRMIIFYCGGLHCPLSPQAAEIAREHGLTNVRVWYEGDPGWVAAGNYLISTAPFVKHMLDHADEHNVLLIDTRPTAVHRKSFVPGSLHINWALWDQKKGLLPSNLDTRLIFYCGGYG